MELGITKGEVKITSGEFVTPLNEKFAVCKVFGFHKSVDITQHEAIQNANLIADAINTANKCGELPSEVLKQRDEAVKVLELIIKHHSDVSNEYTALKNTRPFVLARQAINNIKGK